MESTKMEWSGDVDLNDGLLQKQYEAYKQRLSVVEGLGLEAEGKDYTADRQSILDEVSKDVEFIHSGKIPIFVLCK